MDKKLLEQIVQKLESDFNGDIEFFLSTLKEELNKSNEKLLEKKAVTKDTPTIIDIKNLSKTYKVGGEEIRALKDINLEVHEGEVVALIGTSGSGKSTLLNLIGGLDKPTEGKIEINGQSLAQMKDDQLSKYRNDTIGFVFQFFNLQPYLNIQENVEIPLIFRGQNKHLRAEASKKAVEAVGLLDRIRHLPNQLSGGQMQRVAIARALVNNPKIILADEPTGNLDRATGVEIMNLIRKINKELNTTVIIVTHDSFVANQADRIIRLGDGKLI